MKYTLNVDAFIDCLCCLDGIRIGNENFVSLKTVVGLIKGFPKDAVDEFEIELPNINNLG